MLYTVLTVSTNKFLSFRMLACGFGIGVLQYKHFALVSYINGKNFAVVIPLSTSKHLLI